MAFEGPHTVRLDRSARGGNNLTQKRELAAAFLGRTAAAMTKNRAGIMYTLSALQLSHYRFDFVGTGTVQRINAKREAAVTANKTARARGGGHGPWWTEVRTLSPFSGSS
jgi:hypothetical protein